MEKPYGCIPSQFPCRSRNQREVDNKIHRERFSSTKYNKVCSINFADSDFQAVRDDKNSSCRKREGALASKKLIHITLFCTPIKIIIYSDIC